MMHRKKFLQQCVRCSVGILIAPSVLQSCGGTKYLSAPIVENQLTVLLSAFEIIKNGAVQYHKYIVVQNESLQYPICVYRTSSDRFQALWMKCTHQGTELQVFGDRLQCPAHGSEFSNTGAIQNGPADKPLRTFSTTLTEQNLKINLR
jgi:nitrite reductase/ring-hydroxylating ferredoxin subunit